MVTSKKRGIGSLAVLYFVFFVPVLLRALPSDPNAPSFTTEDVQTMRADFAPFPDAPKTDTESRYLEFYRLRFPEAAHAWGYVEYRGARLFVQSFSPPNAKGTILYLHGYLDHSGKHGQAIGAFLERGWRVLAMDLPGHGLSEGERGDIGNFGEYGEAALALTETARRLYGDSGPLVAIGHSTGCSAWIECLLRTKDVFQSVVFAAPLIRSASWEISKLGFSIVSGFIVNLPNGNNPERDSSINPFPFRSDPLFFEEFPLHWVQALYLWNDLNKAYGTISDEITLIQGNADTVVDWRYNLEYLKARTRKLNLCLVRGGGHFVFRYRGGQWAFACAALDAVLGPPLSREE
jgi:alpha-beta hydrolase superfamily lysophospholipase